MAKAPQDELKRAFMRGIARSVRALDEVVVAATKTAKRVQAGPKRKTKAKSKSTPKAKPRRPARAKAKARTKSRPAAKRGARRR